MKAQLQPEWISREDAAKRLLVSTRSVQQLASAGKIGRGSQRDPKSHQTSTVYKTADVERLAWEREHPEEATVPRFFLGPVGPPLYPEAIGGVLPDPVTERQFFLGPRAPAVAPSTPWLDLESAAEYIGLPASFLLQLIDAGGLPALNVGVRKGGKWRVARRDLDAIEGRLPQRSVQTAGK